MRSKTVFSSVKVQRSGKTPEQMMIENKRAAAVDKLKGKRNAAAKLRKIYDHLPKDQIEYIIEIFKKYEPDNRKTNATPCQSF